MNKNQIWKLLFIVALVLIAIMQVTPLDKKLTSGLDIGGGVSEMDLALAGYWRTCGGRARIRSGRGSRGAELVSGRCTAPASLT